MADSDHSVEERIEQLFGSVGELNRRVDELAHLVQERSSVALAAPMPIMHSSPAEAIVEKKSGIEVSSLLLAFATVSFLLVIALVLRTVVDTGVINRRLGSYAGLTYAALLLFYGYYQYGKSRSRAPVFVVCGTLLILAIVFETFRRYNLFPVSLAYEILGLTLIATVALGARYRVFAAPGVGILGACLTGLFLEFPDPSYPYLAALLLAGSIAAYGGQSIPRCRCLQWPVLGMTALFWLIWTLKARVPLLHGETPGSALYMTWFIPLLVLFALVHIVMALRSALRGAALFGVYEGVLACLTGLGAYGVAQAVLGPWLGHSRAIAGLGGIAALFYFGSAMVVVRTHEKGGRAAGSFLATGLILLVTALPALTGRTLTTVVAWSAVAILVAALSTRWEQRWGRVMSYLMQMFALGTALRWGMFTVRAPLSLTQLCGLAVLAACCLVHYSWCRRYVPDREAGVFRLVDPDDHAAVILLVAALAFAFGAVRLGLWGGLNGATEQFQCGQSMLLNLGALLVAFLGLSLRRVEVLLVAVFVAGLGAVKVFGYDLFHIQGVALVLSVLSVGVTAAIGSLIWARWQNRRTISRDCPVSEE